MRNLLLISLFIFNLKFASAQLQTNSFFISSDHIFEILLCDLKDGAGNLLPIGSEVKNSSPININPLPLVQDISYSYTYQYIYRQVSCGRIENTLFDQSSILKYLPRFCEKNQKIISRSIDYYKPLVKNKVERYFDDEFDWRYSQLESGCIVCLRGPNQNGNSVSSCASQYPDGSISFYPPMSETKLVKVGLVEFYIGGSMSGIFE